MTEQYLLNRLSAKISSEINKVLGSSFELEISPANPKTGSHLAIPLFSVAKKLEKNPANLASDISQKITLAEIQRLEPAGGFLNIWLKAESLAKGLDLDLKQEISYGFSSEGDSRLIFVDYIGLNMAKPFSVGHLRPTLQGQALINLHRSLGYKVIGDTHLGDSGTPFGIWVVGFKLLSSDKKLEEGGAYELGRVYSETKKLIEAEQEAGGSKLKEDVAFWLKKLESQDPEALDYQQKFNEVTQAHMFEVLEELKVKPDENLGESFFLKRAKELTQELVDKKIAIKQEDGSVIVNLEEFGIDTPILLEKSDGTALYATTDLATIEHRIKNYGHTPTKIIYSVDLQQRFHFQQVFSLATKLGWANKTEFLHAWFGQIQEIGSEGKRQKMSSRQGAMYIRDLIDRAMEFATKTVEGRDVEFEDIHKIAIGAIKFNDFAQDRKTNILFDWDRMFSLQGFSGPFVQYAGVRIKSILKKLGEDVSKQESLNSGYSFNKETNLLLLLAQYPEVIKKATNKCEPHHLATFAFELARELNRYYEEVNIINSEQTKKEARIWLLKAVYQVLESSLEILGIEIPSKM